MKRICLIGGTGFIGSNIYKALIENKKNQVFRFSSRENRFIEEIDDKNLIY